ncbi:MAG: filamentous hemagglutinin N-terminal domain-containing protein [Nostoc sp.]|uniref:two-partner secretion domain-containing protein n=1 Tax=Nostoc sp. TaxID=1180 RepID=UPI002FFC803C
MTNLWGWSQALGVSIGGAIAFSVNSAIAQITPDATLPTISSVNKQGNITIIDGGTQVGSNLFHSFNQFSVLDKTTAEFNNAADVQNIISRVTGNNVSNIYGIIKAQDKANLFLINPNGIIFGPNASLEIGGSFLGSTASSLNFADGTKFSATNSQTTPLLTVSVPIGLQFGAVANPISNQSQVNQVNLDGTIKAVGLQVKPGKTLALVGGDITLEGGNLTAASGRIELGSVAGNSLVSLNPTNQGWTLRYENVQNFQNIQLTKRTSNGSDIPSIVDTSGEGGGNIKLHGSTVELKGSNVSLISQTRGDQKGEDLTITARKLIVRDGAQVLTSTKSTGSGGNLIVNASESVEVIRNKTSQGSLSGLFSTTFGEGNAGNITITTARLHVQNGAEISVGSTGMSNFPDLSQFLSAKGKGGDLTVNASESVELIGTSARGNASSLLARTFGSGEAGKITIITGQLIVRDGATITVSSELLKDVTYKGGAPNLGSAGELNVTAGSILLDNEGKLTSNSESGGGGNITLHVRDLLGLGMRRNSQITTNAGGNGNGGNITIYVPNGFIFAVPSENSDISANAVGGNGGNVKIDALAVIGTQYREKPTNYSDITASSEFGLNGKVQINSPDADPSRGLVELPVNLVDASKQIVADCNSGTKIARSSFIRTGRGGLIADPTQPLIADDAVLADWITLSPESQNRAGGIPKRAVVQAQRNTEKKSPKVNSVNESTQIVEAQGWVIDANGNVVLVAQVPTATPHNSWLNTASCAAK